MSRLLNGSTDQIVDGIGAASLNVTGAVTLLAVVKFAANGTWASIIETEASATNKLTMSRTPGDDMRVADESNFADGTTNFQIADGWLIMAATKATGRATPDGHKLPIGGTRTTQALGAAIGSADSNADTVRVGGNDDFASMYVGVAAIFDKVLTTGELDGILSAKTTASINALGPIWLADDSNSFATELLSTRTMDTVGGTDDADDPSGWVYGLAGAPGPSQRFMWMP